MGRVRQSDRADLNARISRKAAAVEYASRDLARARERASELREQMNNLTGSLSRCEEKVEAASAALQKVVDARDAMAEHVRECATRIDITTGEVAKYELQVSDRTAEVAELEAERDDTRSRPAVAGEGRRTVAGGELVAAARRFGRFTAGDIAVTLKMTPKAASAQVKALVTEGVLRETGLKFVGKALFEYVQSEAELEAERAAEASEDETLDRIARESFEEPVPPPAPEPEPEPEPEPAPTAREQIDAARKQVETGDAGATALRAVREFVVARGREFGPADVESATELPREIVDVCVARLLSIGAIRAVGFGDLQLYEYAPAENGAGEARARMREHAQPKAQRGRPVSGTGGKWKISDDNVRALVEAVIEAGGQAAPVPNGHIEITAPNTGKKVQIAATPRGARTVRNDQARIRRDLGLAV